MIFIWITLTTSLKPLLALFTQALLSATFLTEDGVTSTEGLNQTEAFDLRNSTFAFLPELTSITPINHTEGTQPQLEQSYILGTYAYQSSVNFDNYLKELGVSYLLRSFAGMATPVVTISKICPHVKKVIKYLAKNDQSWI